MTHLALLDLDAALDLLGTVTKVSLASLLVFGVVDNELVVDPDPALTGNGSAKLVLSVDGRGEDGLELGEPVISQGRHDKVGHEHVASVPDLVVSRLGRLLTVHDGVVREVEALLAVKGSKVLVKHGQELGAGASERVRKLDTLGLVVLETLPRSLRPGGSELGRSTASEDLGLGVGADDCDLVAGDGQNLVLVLEHHDTLTTQPTDDFGIGLLFVVAGLFLRGSSIDEVGVELGELLTPLQDPAGVSVDRARIDLVRSDQVTDQSGLVPSCRTGHLEIETGIDRLGDRVRAVPITHDQSVVLPLFAQDVVEELLVLRNVGAVDLVVRGHVCPGLAELLGDLERTEVDLSESSLRDDRVLAHSLVLLVVTDKVLDGGTDALALQTVDVGGSDRTGKRGVFGKGLESSTTKRRSLDVDCRGKKTDGVSRLGLGGEQSTGILGEGLREGGSDTGRVRQSGRGGWQES